MDSENMVYYELFFYVLYQNMYILFNKQPKHIFRKKYRDTHLWITFYLMDKSLK